MEIDLEGQGGAKCEFRQTCLPKKTGYRQLYRWEHEPMIDAHQQRMREAGGKHMKTRAALVEHPFGTMKTDMGWRHVRMRGLAKVRAEMNRQMLTYHFQRVLNLIGISTFRNHLKQRGMAG